MPCLGQFGARNIAGRSCGKAGSLQASRFCFGTGRSAKAAWTADGRLLFARPVVSALTSTLPMAIGVLTSAAGVVCEVGIKDLAVDAQGIGASTTSWLRRALTARNHHREHDRHAQDSDRESHGSLKWTSPLPRLRSGQCICRVHTERHSKSHTTTALNICARPKHRGVDTPPGTQVEADASRWMPGVSSEATTAPQLKLT